MTVKVWLIKTTKELKAIHRKMLKKHRNKIFASVEQRRSQFKLFDFDFKVFHGHFTTWQNIQHFKKNAGKKFSQSAVIRKMLSGKL